MEVIEVCILGVGFRKARFRQEIKQEGGEVCEAV
jgi:hypothetical protein